MQTPQGLLDLKVEHLEQKYVHEIYDDIAGHFSDTRYKPWPGVMRFLKNLPPYSLVLDMGCGNGKYSFCLPGGSYWVGSDMSKGLLEAAQNKNGTLIHTIAEQKRGNIVEGGKSNDVNVWRGNLQTRSGIETHNSGEHGHESDADLPIPVNGHHASLYRGSILDSS